MLYAVKYLDTISLEQLISMIHSLYSYDVSSQGHVIKSLSCRSELSLEIGHPTL